MSYPPPYPPVRYHPGQGTVSAAFRPADAPQDLVNTRGGGVAYLAPASLTDGDYGMFRWDMGAAPSGPALHFHRTMSEAFYVLSGRVLLEDGQRTVEAGPGDFLYVPPGGLHAFRNESGEPASMLMIFAPGAPREAYFEELVEIERSGRELGPDEWTDLYARHDQYMVQT
ncbi:MAG TPA: cupin domain-containing protein [Kineosporiaceae bacterium]|nr:cupin domain-containing protein [Kineosporiaceae bacterium]